MSLFRYLFIKTSWYKIRQYFQTASSPLDNLCWFNTPTVFEKWTKQNEPTSKIFPFFTSVVSTVSSSASGSPLTSGAAASSVWAPSSKRKCVKKESYSQETVAFWLLGHFVISFCLFNSFFINFQIIKLKLTKQKSCPKSTRRCSIQKLT